MKQKSIPIHYSELEHYNDLDASDRLLVETAFAAADKAFAPYSQFRVGAAVRLNNGVVVSGNNQENAAYPSGLCAERVALFYAASQYPGVAVNTIAVVAKTIIAELPDPVTPCGSCRQVMAEYEQLSGEKIRVIMANPNGKTLIIKGIEGLLPFGFKGEHLKKSK